MSKPRTKKRVKRERWRRQQKHKAAKAEAKRYAEKLRDLVGGEEQK